MVLAPSSENMPVGGWPSSSAITANASSLGNGGIWSCSFSSSRRYSGGTTSGRDDTACQRKGSLLK